MGIDVGLCHETIKLPKLEQSFSLNSGAQVFFGGYVRNHHAGKQVLQLFYEAYESMALKILHQKAEAARQKWSLDQVWIRHRLGEIPLGEMAVAVLTASVHRQEAYQANIWLMDQIKQDLPIWKKESYADSSSEWVICSH